MSGTLQQSWPLPNGEIKLSITTSEPFPATVWNEDLPDLVKAIELLRLHLGGDM